MFLFILIISTFFVYVYQKILYKNINLKIFIDYIFNINKFLFQWSIESETLNLLSNYKNKNRILAFFNHQSLLDGLFILKYLTDIYPEHKIIFVVKKDLIKIPIIGKYIENNFICLERKIIQDKDYMIKKINEYTHNYTKIVIVIFPEGTIRCTETVIKSNLFCKKNNIQILNNLLCPRYSGIDLINKEFKPDIILNNIIYYLDNNPYKFSKCIYEYELLNNNLPYKCKIITDTINKIDINFEWEIYNIWKQNDKILDLEYCKLNNIYNIIDKYYNIHPNLIQKNDLMFQTSKLFLLLVPISIYVNGYIYGLNTFIVFCTSFLYHKYQKYKLLDIICSICLIILSYFYISHLYSFIFMTIGIISYFLGLIVYKYFKFDNIFIFFHNLLHIFCSIHIIIELLLIYL